MSIETPLRLRLVKARLPLAEPLQRSKQALLNRRLLAVAEQGFPDKFLGERLLSSGSLPLKAQRDWRKLRPERKSSVKRRASWQRSVSSLSSESQQTLLDFGRIGLRLLNHKKRKAGSRQDLRC